jgi:ATP-dependent Clp protease protease subunit
MEMEDNIRHLQEAKELNKRLTELYVKHNSVGKTYEELFETMKFDTFLRAEDAVAWGLADKVMTERPA